MAAFRTLILFLSIGVLIMLLFGKYSGIFVKPEIEVTMAGPFVAVYQSNIGEYSGTGKIFEKIENSLWEHGVENYKNLAVFFDDPQYAEAANLRSIAGRIIEPDQLYKINKAKHQYTFFTYPEQQSAIVKYRFRNALSLYAAVYKVYPLLREYANENGIPDNPILEIHDTKTDNNSKEIIFILPLSKAGLPGLP